jgi:hypothetical protein
VLGQTSLHGVLSRVERLGDKLRVAMDAGARRILIPTENSRDFALLPAEILDKLRMSSTANRPRRRSRQWQSRRSIKHAPRARMKRFSAGAQAVTRVLEICAGKERRGRVFSATT